MSTPSIVIASVARTAAGSFNGAFADTPAHQRGAGADRRRGKRDGRGNPRRGSAERRGPEPGASGDESLDPAGSHCLPGPPPPRFGSSRRGGRPAADRHWRRQDHRRRRSGVDVYDAALCASAQRHQYGGHEMIDTAVPTRQPRRPGDLPMRSFLSPKGPARVMSSSTRTNISAVPPRSTGMTKPRPPFDKEARWQPGMPPATMVARPQPFV